MWCVSCWCSGCQNALGIYWRLHPTYPQHPRKHHLKYCYWILQYCQQSKENALNLKKQICATLTLDKMVLPLPVKLTEVFNICTIRSWAWLYYERVNIVNLVTWATHTSWEDPLPQQSLSGGLQCQAFVGSDHPSDHIASLCLFQWRHLPVLAFELM